MKKIVAINDCSYVMEELIPHLPYEVEFLQRGRGTWEKTAGIALRILRAQGDIYHVNYALQDAYLTYLLKGRIDVLWCHGSDVRTTAKKGRLGWMVRADIKHANRILYATPDLAQYLPADATYLPIPVDTWKFTPRPDPNNPIPLCFELGYESSRFNTRKKDVPYDFMPRFLTQFSIFVDRMTIPSFSTTCLQAMSCGLATIDYRHKDYIDERYKRLVENMKYRREEGEKNRQFVVDNHDVRKVAAQLTGIYAP